PTPATSTLSLHDALPIFPAAASPELALDLPGYLERFGPSPETEAGIRLAAEFLAAWERQQAKPPPPDGFTLVGAKGAGKTTLLRSEEHTSELQSRGHLVC